MSVSPNINITIHPITFAVVEDEAAGTACPVCGDAVFFQAKKLICEAKFSIDGKESGQVVVPMEGICSSCGDVVAEIVR